jgi:hypothetical protein
MNREGTMADVVRKGTITSGIYNGWIVSVEDDRENTGGFLILIESGAEGYDHLVEDHASLDQFFLESGWHVQWEYSQRTE